MKATERPAEPSRDAWLADFLATLTAILGGKVIVSPEFAWRSGNYLVRSAQPANEASDVTIAIEVAQGDDVPKATFVFKRCADPLHCGKEVARWLHERPNC